MKRSTKAVFLCKHVRCKAVETTFAKLSGYQAMPAIAVIASAALSLRGDSFVS